MEIQPFDKTYMRQPYKKEPYCMLKMSLRLSQILCGCYSVTGPGNLISLNDVINFMKYLAKTEE